MKGIAYGQSLTPNEEGYVLYTEKQDVRCLQCLQNEPLKDSIIQNRDSLISIQSAFIDTSVVVVKQLNSDLSDAKESLSQMKKKRKRAFFIGGGIVAVVETFLLIILTK